MPEKAHRSSLGKTKQQARSGRPRTFNREQALVSALKLFWEWGYEPASITDLCAVMKINPPSLYAAFGSKAKLFLEAINYYERTYWDAAWERMEAASNVHEGITNFFHEAVRILKAPDVPCGCMVVLAAINVSADSPEVIEAVKVLRQEGTDSFLRILSKGIEEGKLPADTNIKALATALNTILEGMSIQAKDGLSIEELDEIAHVAVTMLPASPESAKDF